MMQDLNTLEQKYRAAAEAAATPAELDAVRVEALGKSGALTGLMKELGKLAAEERRERGAALNRLKDSLTAAIETRRSALQEAGLDARLAAERVDVSLPVRPEAEGRLHPISQTIDEVVAIFGAMGFRVAEGPDIEDDFHNFTALNIPAHHPARQMMDTFYVADPANPALDSGVGGAAAVQGGNKNPAAAVPGGEKKPAAAVQGGNKVLRTHTSPVQVRTMQSVPPPIRIIAPGRTYRSDSDMTHTPMFHQVEGLAIDEKIHMGHLKGCLTEFCRAYFGLPDLKLRFRPSYFPFTEPSAEVDIGCSRQGGELKIGEGDPRESGDWLEILGCGMVHPKVLEMCGIDPARWQGFAFGMGIERIAMLKYGIPDLRTFFEADLRWLRHYGFLPLDVPSPTGGLTR